MWYLKCDLYLYDDKMIGINFGFWFNYYLLIMEIDDVIGVGWMLGYEDVDFFMILFV